jgi:hypothetical protein
MNNIKCAATAEGGYGDGRLAWERAQQNENCEAQYIIIIKFQIGALHKILCSLSSSSEQALIITVLLKLLPQDAPKKDYVLLSDSLMDMRRNFMVNGNFYSIHHNQNVIGG